MPPIVIVTYRPDWPAEFLSVATQLRQALGPAVGSRGLPTTLFYDAQGRQGHAHFGVLNAAALESRLRQLRPSP